MLTASDDHIARLAREANPVPALIELLWNAVDAEASMVEVEFRRNITGGITHTMVRDDGHGITSDEVAATFGRIGGSWKAFNKKSKNGKRRLHGKLGEGRLRVFALGSRIRWISVSDNTAGHREQVAILASRENRNRFSVHVNESGATTTGTTVVAQNDEQRSLGQLDSPAAVSALLSAFAPLLTNDPSLRISYGGTVLDPTQEMSHDFTTALRFGAADELQATLRIIEWRSGKHRTVSFGRDGDHFPVEMPGAAFENHFPFSAYVTWNQLGAEDLSLLGLAENAPGTVGELWAKAEQAIRAHFNTRKHERQLAQIDQWKQSGVYPYKDEPADDAEKAERAVFDSVSGAIFAHIPKAKRQAQLTLGLLRHTLRHDPDNFATVLQEITALDKTDLETFTKPLS